MKKNKPEVVYFGGFTCAVLSMGETENKITVKMEDIKPREYAVFVKGLDSISWVQVSKWFRYKGAAINKMCRMYGI